MPLDTTKDLFYLILAIATGGVAIFLSWALCEIARMLHQANDVVTDAREKLHKIERIVETIVDGVKGLIAFIPELKKRRK